MTLCTLLQNYLVNEEVIRPSIDFILSHLYGQFNLFPRKAMTFNSRGQVSISSKEELVKKYLESHFVDCRINAYPELDDGELVYQNTPSFMFIDLDLSSFGNKAGSDKELRTVLAKVKLKIDGCPTVLWSGGGYHIYQPLQPPKDRSGMEIAFENIIDFQSCRTIDKDLTTEFMRFAPKYFSRRRDSNNHPSVKSCLLRVPNTVNPKYGNRVEVIQKWDGKRTSIRPLVNEYLTYLINKKFSALEVNQKYRPVSNKPSKIN